MGVESSKSDLSVMDEPLHREGHLLQMNNKQDLLLSSVSDDFTH